MIAYNGGSVSRLVENLSKPTMWVTDKKNKSMRYANAQATESVDPSLKQRMAEGTVILHVECDPTWVWRSNGRSLDACEAFIDSFQIVKAEIRFYDYANTVYGRGHIPAEKVVRMLRDRGVKVEIK